MPDYLRDREEERVCQKWKNRHHRVMIHLAWDVHLRFTCVHGIENRDAKDTRHENEGGSERRILSEGRSVRANGKGKGTSHKERRSGMERSAARGWWEGEYRDTPSDRNRYRDCQGKPDVRGVGWREGGLPAVGFLYFSRKHYELVRKYLRRMALSYAQGFARRSLSTTTTTALRPLVRISAHSIKGEIERSNLPHAKTNLPTWRRVGRVSRIITENVHRKTCMCYEGEGSRSDNFWLRHREFSE